MRASLTTFAIALSFLMYLPLWKRILTRKTTGDFSKPAQWGILALQFCGWSIAYLDGARFLYAFYYPSQVLFVAVTLALVYRYYD